MTDPRESERQGCDTGCDTDAHDFTQLPGPCPVCHAEGQVLHGASLHSPGRPKIVVCPRCRGTGEVIR